MPAGWREESKSPGAALTYSSHRIAVARQWWPDIPYAGEPLPEQ
jgi:hypothetical protein